MNAPFKNSRRAFLLKSTGLVIGFTFGSELIADNTAPDLPIDLKNNLNILKAKCCFWIWATFSVFKRISDQTF